MRFTAAARTVSETINAAAIVTYTTSGSTTVSRQPRAADCANLGPDLQRAHSPAPGAGLGCAPVHTADVDSFQQMVEKAANIARQEGLAKEGEALVVTAGVPFGTPGATNVLRPRLGAKRARAGLAANIQSLKWEAGGKGAGGAFPKSASIGFEMKQSIFGG